MILKFFLVMLAIAIVDVFWTWYIQFSGDRQAFKAAASSTMIMLIGAFATTNYVHDNVLIIAAAIGAFIGTYITVKFTKREPVVPPVIKTYPTYMLPGDSGGMIRVVNELPTNPFVGERCYLVTDNLVYIFHHENGWMIETKFAK